MQPWEAEAGPCHYHGARPSGPESGARLTGEGARAGARTECQCHRDLAFNLTLISFKLCDFQTRPESFACRPSPGPWRRTNMDRLNEFQTERAVQQVGRFVSKGEPP